MNVIVTGGAGFIGSHIVENLLEYKKISKIIILDNLSNGNKKNLQSVIQNKKIAFIKVDICNKNKIKKYFKNISFVFHLAGIADIVPSIKNPTKYLNTNFNGTINILECAKKYKVKKIIYAASSSCYGYTPNKKIAENFRISLLNPYAFSKYMGEQALLNWSKICNISFISLRLFNVFGPRSKNSGSYSAVISLFIKQKLMGKPFTIVGNGKQTRDFVHVKDVSNAFVLAAFSKVKNEIFNIGTGKSVKILELVKILKGKKIHTKKRALETKYSRANVKKVRKRLNWKPNKNFKTSLLELLNIKS